MTAVDGHPLRHGTMTDSQPSARDMPARGGADGTAPGGRTGPRRGAEAAS